VKNRNIRSRWLSYLDAQLHRLSPDEVEVSEWFQNSMAVVAARFPYFDMASLCLLTPEQRIEYIASLIAADDPELADEIRHDSWKIHLITAIRCSYVGDVAAEVECLKVVLDDLDRRGPLAVGNDLKLGASRRTQQAAFGQRRGKQRKEEASAKVAEMQKRAEEIWAGNRSLSVSGVARLIERRFELGKAGTIRRYIKKPLEIVGSEPS